MLLPHARILVVDDEPEVLFALKLLRKTELREIVTEPPPSCSPCCASSASTPCCSP